MVMTFISCALFLDVLLGGGDDAARLALKNGSSFQINQPNRKIPMYGLLAFSFLGPMSLRLFCYGLIF